MKNAIFKLSGIVFVAEEGPSFGTPVFTNEDHDSYFIQSSSDERYITDFVALSSRKNWKRSFAELRSNRSFVIGTPFLYGFRDIDQRLTVDEKFVLQLKLQDEFDHYIQLPFLSFAIAKFLESYELAMRVSNVKEVRAAIESGELVRPLFLEQPEVPLDQAPSVVDVMDEVEAPRNRQPFSPERVERLKQLWEAGLSASQIAAELGGVTRNAIIGKIHRLGLGSRVKNSSFAPPRVAQASIDLESVRQEILSSNEAPSNNYRKSLLELNEGTCHWPVGSPESSEFSFCGAPTLTGLPYCASHARMAYKPASDPRSDT